MTNVEYQAAEFEGKLVLQTTTKPVFYVATWGQTPHKVEAQKFDNWEQVKDWAGKQNPPATVLHSV
jgi:hypothetical protein